METKDLTKGDFINRHNRNKLVIVKLAKNNFLTFLVYDVENPQVPGYPVMSLTYYNSKKEAHKDIEKTYKRVGFKPKYPSKGYYHC